MKTVSAVLLASAVALSSTAFRHMEPAGQDFLAALGITETQAQDHVFQTFWANYVSHPTGARIRAVATADRAALVREAAKFAREYVASPAFAERYARTREQARPTPPEAARSADDQAAEMKADLERQIAEIEAQAKAQPDLREMLLQTAEMLREQMAAIDSPDSYLRDPTYQAALAQGAAEEKALYEAALVEWEKEYPTDPKVRVARRLAATVAECSDVDFGAALVDGKDGKKLFANPLYEEKSPVWKACFRAGPEALDAARAVAREWEASLR